MGASPVSTTCMRVSAPASSGAFSSSRSEAAGELVTSIAVGGLSALKVSAALLRIFGSSVTVITGVGGIAVLIVREVEVCTIAIVFPVVPGGAL